MGGRGSESKLGNKQMNFEDYELNNTVKKIIEAAEMERQNLEVAGGESTHPFKKCACCGLYMIPINAIHWECEECGWIDDENQNRHPDSLDGPNEICLNEARKRYWKLGRRA